WPCDPKSFERSGVLPPGKRPRLGIQGVLPGEASAEHGGMAWIRLPATPPTGATSRRRPPRGGLPNTTAYGRGWLLCVQVLYASVKSLDFLLLRLLGPERVPEVRELRADRCGGCHALISGTVLPSC